MAKLVEGDVMHQLVYTSVAQPDLPSAELFRIIEQSARNNPSSDITGFLLMKDGRFLQFIEGPLMALEELIDRLRRDPRHHSIRVIHRLPVSSRTFPTWRMRRLTGSPQDLHDLESAWRANGTGGGVPSSVRELVAGKRAA